MPAKRATPIDTVAAHLDLKGVMPQPNYLRQWLNDLADQKINAVLLEYEDKFPFDGIHVADDEASVWTSRFVRQFQRWAKQAGIEVIPLQQCLGHLEYVFRWPRYRRLALDTKYPSTADIFKPKGRQLVLDMLQQVVDAHPESEFVHLGMDEAHALVTWGERHGKSTLEPFISFLDELLEIVDGADKQAIIWADMIQDHFDPRLVRRMADRVTVAVWDYGAREPWRPHVRLRGQRVFRAWQTRADDPAAPPISAGTRYIEDLPPTLRKQATVGRKDDMVRSLVELDVLSRHGMDVVGAGTVRMSSQGAVLPDYNHLRRNARTWAEVARRNGCTMVIGTSWARGTTLCPPNFSIDLNWPSLRELARACGKRPARFWPGVPQTTVDRIVSQLGRCTQDWRLELELAEEIDQLEPKVTKHRHEWRSMGLMARVLHLHRRADFAHEEVNFFAANDRVVVPEWQRRLKDQREIMADLRKLRRTVDAHFGKRYHGEAYREWLRHLFDVRLDKLKQLHTETRQRLAEAQQRERA